jgi:hypothetical protein
MEIERGARVVSRAHQENIYEKSFSHNVRFEFELFDPAPPKGLLAFSLFSNIHIGGDFLCVCTPAGCHENGESTGKGDG